MRSPTLFISLLLAATLSSAVPHALSGNVGEDLERRIWRRQLASSTNGMSWSLVETGSTTILAATSASTPADPTSSSAPTTSTEAESTASTTAESSSESSAATDSTTASSSPSSSPLPSSSSRPASSASSPLPSTPSHSSSSSASAAKASHEAEFVGSSSNIFSSSNKLFAVGIIVIIAIIVLSIFLLIFLIKRVMHRPRFIDPLDYPDNYNARDYDPDTLAKRRYSQFGQSGTINPAQLSPSSSTDSYDSDEKPHNGGFYENVVPAMTRGQPAPPCPPPPPPPSSSKPFSNLAPVDDAQTNHAGIGSRSRLAQPPTFGNLTPVPALAKPPRVEHPLPPSSSAPRRKPSYVSTLPLAPSFTAKPPHSSRIDPRTRSAQVESAEAARRAPTTRRQPPPPVPMPIFGPPPTPQSTPSRASPSERYTALPSASSTRQPRRSIPSSSTPPLAEHFPRPPNHSQPTQGSGRYTFQDGASRTRDKEPRRHRHSPPAGRESPLREF
ncbi:hypothetical protein JCM10212_000028 [Sporobolomyces blumeae]